jgi:hypothetical protein
MPKKSTNSENLLHFTIEKPAGKSASIGKISVPRVSWEDLAETLEKLITKANESGAEIKAVRGTLTLY